MVLYSAVSSPLDRSKRFTLSRRKEGGGNESTEEKEERKT